MRVFSIHGRFQIFHNNHLRYLKNAIAHCSDSTKLIIGITQPNNSALSSGPGHPAHRSRSTDNPLTYEQRKEMISYVMQDEFGDQGIDYEIIPFPIENREVDLSKLIPVGTIMTMGYCDEWTTQKISYLASTGYQNICIVQNDYESNRISGRKIRAMIRSNDSGWLNMVPPAVSTYIHEFGILGIINNV